MREKECDAEGTLIFMLSNIAQGTRVEIKSHYDDSPYITTVESASAGGEVLLDVMRLGGSETRLSENKPYVLRFYTERGVFKYSAVLRGYTRKEKIDYMQFQTSGEGEKVQRRQAFRLPCGEDVNLCIIENVEDERVMLKGYIRDISSGGVKLLTQHELDASNLLEITLRFIGEEFRVFGTILLKQPIKEPDAIYDWAYGIEFIGISEEDSEKISMYVHQKQHESRTTN
jgi:c-di-GMP-binding flagellar brake protein YcgR